MAELSIDPLMSRMLLVSKSTGIGMYAMVSTKMLIAVVLMISKNEEESMPSLIKEITRFFQIKAWKNGEIRRIKKDNICVATNALSFSFDKTRLMQKPIIVLSKATDIAITKDSFKASSSLVVK